MVSTQILGGNELNLINSYEYGQADMFRIDSVLLATAVNCLNDILSCGVVPQRVAIVDRLNSLVLLKDARCRSAMPTDFRWLLNAGNTLIKLVEIEPAAVERSFDFQGGVRWLMFVTEDAPSTIEEVQDKGVERMDIDRRLSTGIGTSTNRSIRGPQLRWRWGVAHCHNTLFLRRNTD